MGHSSQFSVPSYLSSTTAVAVHIDTTLQKTNKQTAFLRLYLWLLPRLFLCTVLSLCRFSSKLKFRRDRTQLKAKQECKRDGTKENPFILYLKYSSGLKVIKIASPSRCSQCSYVRVVFIGLSTFETKGHSDDDDDAHACNLCASNYCLSSRIFLTCGLWLSKWLMFCWFLQATHWKSEQARRSRWNL